MDEHCFEVAPKRFTYYQTTKSEIGITLNLPFKGSTMCPCMYVRECVTLNVYILFVSLKMKIPPNSSTTRPDIICFSLVVAFCCYILLITKCVHSVYTDDRFYGSIYSYKSVNSVIH